MKGHPKSAFWCSSGPREDTERKTWFLFVLAGFSGKLQFLGTKVREADFFCVPASSVPAGEKQALLKQIIEAASVFFNIFSEKVRGCDVCKFFEGKIGRILDGLLGSATDLPLPW